MQGRDHLLDIMLEIEKIVGDVKILVIDVSGITNEAEVPHED